MSKTRKSLATTKGKDTSRRAKPFVAGVGDIAQQMFKRCHTLMCNCCREH